MPVLPYTRWFKYDRDKLWLVYTQSVPVIFEPPCIKRHILQRKWILNCTIYIVWRHSPETKSNSDPQNRYYESIKYVVYLLLCPWVRQLFAYKASIRSKRHGKRNALYNNRTTILRCYMLRFKQTITTETHHWKLLAKIYLCLCTPSKHMGNRGIAPVVLKLGTGWGWAVSFMPQSLYPRIKSSSYAMNRR